MTDANPVAREISWLTTTLLMVATYTMAIASIALVEVSSAAAVVAAAATGALATILLVQVLSHLLTYNDLVRTATSHVLPKRWLDMEVADD